MRIAIIGDVHLGWSQVDVEYFNRSDYDLILFCGDLPGRSHQGALDVARAVSLVRKPALMVPGNHDGTTFLQVAAELTRLGVVRRPLARGMPYRVAKLEEALQPVVLGGYSRHRYALGGVDLDVVVGRPHAMDREVLGFGPYLEEAFGVGTLEQSAAKLMSLVDQCGDTVLFLAHNGVAGLGSEAEHIWGGLRVRRDGDNGDTDLAEAVSYAQQLGKRVLAVVAGHMHHQGDDGDRRWWIRRDGVLYVNAARVPRVFRRRKRQWRHHVCLVMTQDHAIAEEVLVYDGAEVSV